MTRLSPRWSSLSLKRLTGERSALVRGPLDFRIVQEKIALKSKDFFSLRNRREGGRRRVFRSFLGGTRMTKIKQTISQHVYLERDADNVYVSHSLSRRVALLFGWIYFSVKKKNAL